MEKCKDKLTRVCKKCSEEKDLDHFNKRIRNGNTTYSYLCKICTVKIRKEYMAQYFKDHKEDIQTKQRAYNQTNKTQIQEQQRNKHKTDVETLSTRYLKHLVSHKQPYSSNIVSDLQLNRYKQHIQTTRLCRQLNS